MRVVSRWALAALVAFLAVFSVLILADSARAATSQCAPIDQVVEGLAANYGEELIGDGGGAGGSRLMVFAHPDGKTWTVIGLMPDGTGCLVASGNDWKAYEPTPPGSET